MKLILGSANFGAQYGYYKKKKFKLNDFKDIVEIANNSNINLIDSAIQYKNSHKLLATQNFLNFFLISKINVNVHNKNYKSELKYKIISLKKKFGQRLKGVLIHNFDELNQKISRNALSTLIEAKKSGYIKQFGISIYNLNKLKFIHNLWPDIIQLPFNVFDQRLLRSPWLNIIQKKKIELHARSSFLQGVLINKEIPFFLKKYEVDFYNWHKWCKKKNITPLQGCIEFIKNYNKYIDYVVVGFNSANQLSDIIKQYKRKTMLNNFFFKKFEKKNINLIDPRKWNYQKIKK